MPNFKEFIKGFEEKPEQPMQEQPKPQPKEANVRNWVKKNYPNDSLADNIRGDMTFDDLYKHMQESKDGSDFYEFASEKGKDIDSGVRENIFKGMSDYHGKPYDHFYNMWLEGGKKPQPKENRDQIIEKVNQKMMNANTYGALGDKENYEKSIAEAEELRKGLAPNPQPKQGSFEQVFGDNQPREEFSQEDKAALVATYGAFPEEGIVARKLPNGNYLTNILSGADTEPEEVDEATLSKVFDELRGEKGFEEIINEWRENPNLIRERRNVQ